jgi:hypothetical protein
LNIERFLFGLDELVDGLSQLRSDLGTDLFSIEIVLNLLIEDVFFEFIAGYRHSNGVFVLKNIAQFHSLDI